MDVDAAISQIELKHGFNFKQKQSEAVKSILSNQDTFVVLPTGYGKTKIYMYLPELYELVDGTPGSILVISPLQSLMMDQVHNLSKEGIKATVVGEIQNDKRVANAIVDGDYSIVFSSPEAALTPGLWRQCFTRGKFHSALRAVIIDEAHCITEWDSEFRQDYNKLAHLRSVVPENTTFVPLTATATTAMRSDILQKLDICESESKTVWLLPDRKNITYILYKSKKELPELNWLLNDITSNQENAKKVIVYCRNIASCAMLYEHFSVHLPQTMVVEERLVGMFHRSTAKSNKDHVLSEFPKKNSRLRVVFATVAFGMGVDIPDVEYVVHWGAPRGLEQYAQESGRGGRDGRQSFSIIYYSGLYIAKHRAAASVRDFCNANGCLRTILNKHFDLTTNRGQFKSLTPVSIIDCCKCCSACFASCECGNCFQPKCYKNSFDNLKVTYSFVPVTDELAVRQFNDKQLRYLQLNLCDYRDNLKDENQDNCHHFDETLIDSIIQNYSLIMCSDDLLDLGLLNTDLAEEILLLVEEIEHV